MTRSRARREARVAHGSAPGQEIPPGLGEALGLAPKTKVASARGATSHEWGGKRLKEFNAVFIDNKCEVPLARTDARKVQHRKMKANIVPMPQTCTTKPDERLKVRLVAQGNRDKEAVGIGPSSPTLGKGGFCSVIIAAARWNFPLMGGDAPAAFLKQYAELLKRGAFVWCPPGLPWAGRLIKLTKVTSMV